MAEKARKVLTRDGKGQIAVVEGPLAEPAKGQVQIEVKASLISPGTELGGVKRSRENPSDRPARPFGYANSGVVIGQGEGCEDIPLGTRLACMGGGYAEHASHANIPRNMAVPMPGGLSFDHAAFVTLAATAMNAIRRAELQFAEFLAVAGLGVVGQMSCQLGRLSGCHVIGMDRLPMRLNVAKTAGLERPLNIDEEDAVEVSKTFTRGYGLDAGFIAHGGDGNPAFNTLYGMLKQAPDSHKMGRIVIVGGARIETGFAASRGNIDVRSAARTGAGYHDEVWEHGSDYPPVFVQWTTTRNLEECLILLDNGGLKAEPLITHRTPLDDAPDACEDLIQRPNEALGVVINP
jgi:threonine dehydrogenase-like Zn-dependent dehydrogenase